ncbi:uncharacterized protein VTP21DRAFT_5361 [Calcarisporiella thermophila]|uniref:uncharacterized protein n=1 Tax=Calcarisporiella thermophila TaxID=911321 RepID=UPI003742CA25
MQFKSLIALFSLLFACLLLAAAAPVTLPTPGEKAASLLRLRVRSSEISLLGWLFGKPEGVQWTSEELIQLQESMRAEVEARRDALAGLLAEP